MLDADLKCLRMLIDLNNESKMPGNYIKPWRYSSSMAGVELPIVSYSKFYKTIASLGENSAVESFGFHQITKNFTRPGDAFNSTNKQLLRRLSNSQKRDCLNCRRENKNSNSDRTYKKQWNMKDHLIFHLPNPLSSGDTYEFQIFKGLKNVILYWKDAEFMLHHPIAKQFHKWQWRAAMPEETFFATLIRLRVDNITNSITQVFHNLRS